MTTIILPPEIEASLADAANKNGTTPELLALETLRRAFPSEEPPQPSNGKSAYDYLKDYIGKVEGTGEAFSENCGERFADYLVEKHKATGS